MYINMSSVEPTETKLTWEQKKKDYMREYMRKRYAEKREQVFEETRKRQAVWREKKRAEKQPIIREKKLGKLNEKLAILKQQFQSNGLELVV